MADIISLGIVKFELFYMAYRLWRDQPELCPLYLGIESFTNTAIVFFIVALNLHTVSTYNLARKTIEKYSTPNGTKLIGDDNHVPADVYVENGNDSSYEAIIPSRSITIDYSKPKNRVSVTLPVLFTWFVAISMSIPLFIYGNVLPSPENPKICGLVQFNRSNSLILQILLMKMRIILPTLFLLFSTIYVMCKFFAARQKIRPCGLEEDVIVILKLALSLSLTYILFSMQRIFGSLLFELISRPLMEYKYPKFGETTGMIFCMIHHSMPAIRPIIYCCFEQNLWNDMKRCCCCFGCCCCSRTSGRSTTKTVADTRSRYSHKW